ncbi:hypothetical protein V2J09_018927 [Rumex salicifolius]
MQEKQYSNRAGARVRISPTLGELLKWVEHHNGCGYGSGSEENTSSSSQQVIELTDLDTYLDSIPPSNPFVLSFHNLTYSVKVKKSHKLLLNDVSGEAKEGEIMAVLGASGSGKSTLIDALADRISKESLNGLVRLNGEVLESKMLKVISAYVMQDDLLFPMLTVEETLMFSAEFRLPRMLSKSKKAARVQALIDQLGLRNAAKTVIGDESHRGVSGGERRRVSIGIDIIHDPIILFLDEPTSGLDSTSAFMVIKVLKRIAQSGSIVITSIHQPSQRIISLLDRLLFISRGQTVFSGAPATLPAFFSDFGRPIPENENKAEFALDLIRELEESPEGTNELVQFNKSWQDKCNKNSSARTKSSTRHLTLQDAISASISRGKLVSGVANETQGRSNVPKYANPFWVEVYVIGKRSLMNSRRMPELFGMRFGAILVTGIILATVYWHLDDSPKGVKERLGFFSFAMSTTFYTCAEAVPNFLQERYIFLRETSFHAYRRTSYVLSHALISLPSLLVLSITFAAVTFYAVSLAGGTAGFLNFFIFILASFWAGHSFVTFLSGVVTHVMLGYTVVVAIIAYFVLFGGFFIAPDRIPIYWIWFHYISLVKYPYEGVLQNEFGDPTRCFVKGTQMFDNSPLQAVPETMKVKLLSSLGGVMGMNLTANSCVTTGRDILEQQGITDLDQMNCLLITIAWGFFFRFLFYLTLLFGGKNKRK